MADPAKKRSNPATSRGGESHTRGAKAPRLATRDGPTEGRGGKPRSPPAGGNKTASGPLAAGTSKAGPSNLSPKTGASDAANLGLPNRQDTIVRTAGRRSTPRMDLQDTDPRVAP
ncbi:unnamed protein product [Acanthoscelides obtectus]|uniref:Uncharacterized protein n=1 Tax=Acanthoscelides obtectus TaxID=200917 RepID=A0A9P0QHE4_ACAOB|nr:unnamed protein product [Acanthoscelides obtectus]CAK1683436.1 hypothetical protein AOBTE_LOCUS34244 [Acanthoscelides obtectus]